MAALIRSSIGLCKPLACVDGSVFLACSGPDFVRFSSISCERSKRRGAVRACSDSCGSLAPLQLESPTGQFLSQMLMSHPHLVTAAVEQQLQQLQMEEPSVSGSDDLVLCKRIAEVKANEKRKVVEEILYALVVQKFMGANVSLIQSPDQADRWASQDEKLEQLHSLEANEMIRSHLALLGNLEIDSTTVAELRKLKVGEVYGQSVMYGYFLKRVDQRFQLERSMKILPDVVDEAGTSQLRSYVMSFDGETLKRYAKIRSKQAISIIDKHTQALFGRPDDSSKDELIKLSFGGLKSLVLEAVTFGSFLWDVESSMDSILA